MPPSPPMPELTGPVTIHGRRYRQLFWSIIILFLYTSVARFEHADFITSVLLTLTILLMLRTVSIGRYWRAGLQALVAIALIFDLSNILIADQIVTHRLSILSDLVYGVFLASAIVILSYQLNLIEKVDSDALLGAVSVYILIGVLWSLFYHLSFLVNSDNFNHIEEIRSNKLVLVYFSFTTLTTLGYGDIVPTDSFAMGLSNMEAIVGQMYPTVFVARLVSLYTNELQRERDKC